MINQLLDEIYIDLSQIKIVPMKVGKEKHVCIMFSYNVLVSKNYNYDKNDKEKLFDLFSLEEIESQLLQEVAFYNGRTRDDYDEDRWKNLSIDRKLRLAKIPKYIADRNLNDLIMYIEFLDLNF